MAPFSPPSPPSRPSSPRAGGRPVSVKKLSSARSGASSKRPVFNAPSLPTSMKVKATTKFGGKGTSARDLIRGGCCGAQPTIAPPTISTPVVPPTPSAETPTAPATACPIGWTRLPNGTCVDERGLPATSPPPACPVEGGGARGTGCFVRFCDSLLCMANFTPQEQNAAAEIYEILDRHGIRAGLLAIRILLNRSHFVAEQAYNAASDLRARTDLKDYLRLLERSEKRVDGLIDFVDENGGLRPAEAPGKTSTSSLRSRPGQGFWAGVTSYFRGD